MSSGEPFIGPKLPPSIYYAEDRFKAACTWGDGPDIMIEFYDENGVIVDADLTIKQALHLMQQLSQSIGAAYGVEFEYMNDCLSSAATEPAIGPVTNADEAF